MSEPTILIIEPNLDYSKTISSELKSLGFETILKTDVIDPDILINLPQNIVSIVLNLELRSIEGLTIYSFLKNHRKYSETTFTFLADDDNTYYLLDNMPLERAIVLKKESPSKEMIGAIVDNITYNCEDTDEASYILESSGNLAEISAKDLLEFVKNVFFNGKLVLNHALNFAIIMFEKGEIAEISYNNLSQSQAIEEVSGWTNGNFRLERRHYNLNEMRIIAHENNNAEKPVQNIGLSISDLLQDVFSFLYGFLSEQISGGQVNYIFQEKLESFKQKYQKGKTFTFKPYEIEKIVFDWEVIETDVASYVDLFKQIFSTAKAYHPEIDLNDFLEKLNELAPYLEKIKFIDLLLEEEKLVDITEVYEMS